MHFLKWKVVEFKGLKMTRGTPPADWVAYVVVLSVVAAMMLGKYLIAKGDEPINDVVKENIEELEHTIENIEHSVEDVIENIENKLK